MKEKLESLLTVRKRAIAKNVLYASLFLLVAMAIIGLRFLFPYHFLASLPFLFLSLVHVFRIVRTTHEKLNTTERYVATRKFLYTYYRYFFVLLCICIVGYISAKVIPSDSHPFENLSTSEINTFVDESVDVSVLHFDRLHITGNELIESGLLTKQELSADEQAELLALWNEFLSATRDSEEVTDIHRYFAQISYWDMRDAHTKSFMVSYGLYLKKYEMFGRIIDAVGTEDRIIKALNEYSPVFEGKDAYSHIRERYVDKDSFIRRTFGRGYAWFLGATVDTSTYGEDYRALARGAKESHAHIISHLPTTALILAHKYQSDVENSLFKGWFPIQMNVADTMEKVHLSARHETFISREQIHEMRPFLEPGDILIERRNWHLSNVGIPGFWPHAALHLGTLEEAETYFSDVFPYEGFDTYNELLSSRFPDFYNRYASENTEGDPYAVIEGLAAGIILQSLETSAKADYLGVLRPRLTKEEKLAALIRAIGNYGKPYDYNFDFETRDEIVCSELVYDAYLPHNGYGGIDFELTVTSGRKMISPNAMVEKFYREQGNADRDLDFVYFLDGSEELDRAFVKDEGAFSTTWTRSKFSNLQE